MIDIQSGTVRRMPFDERHLIPSDENSWFLTRYMLRQIIETVPGFAHHGRMTDHRSPLGASTSTNQSSVAAEAASVLTLSNPGRNVKSADASYKPRISSRDQVRLTENEPPDTRDREKG
ncbi:hypothetical protein LHFGNBLO_000066 [Mesorhizobium sp. AR10]|uniref:hypothetical protein n=1 Tax=Mesorhizobium sp. AR10 TaxID=2865839 RepID=UPI002160F094|nr:hypothetical protein [Mesorhizobium sp. AR10]UVK38780.1 hypothetical protein LHFGNBLO_000066 [Mesorhizobium sp. AR10]